MTGTGAAAHPGTSVTAAGGQVPYGLGIGIGPGLPPCREDRKRRRAREDEEGEEKRREEEAGEQDGAGPDGKDGEKAVEETEAVAGEQMDVVDSENENEQDQDNDDGSAPALRRSNRRPLPSGTSLAHTHRQTRSSPSPTPSSTSTSSDSSPRYRPILPDLDLAHTVFAQHAAKDWCDALAAGGGQTVQGPGVNPASAGQVMMGGTGGMQREGEVVADFLYAIKVKSEFPRPRGG